ncbi:MAG TPA: oligosaccharide flippase family protein [Bacteroidia bacterium]|nr:oligosaccharide flippase family protein [Bacteroidia bacterium]
MNPLKKLAGETAIYGLPTIVGRLMNYLLVPLYTYTFTTQDYGTMTVMYAYASFLMIVLTYGMETALFNFCRNEPNKEKVYGTAIVSVLISSFAFIFLLNYFKQNIADLIRFPQHPEYIVWFAFILGFDAISSIAFAKLREQHKAKQFAFFKIVNISINIAFNFFFIYFCSTIYKNHNSVFYHFVSSFYNPQTGIGYAFIAGLCASVTTIFLLIPSILKTGFQFDKVLWKRMMLYASPLLLAGLAGMINETFDRIILQYLLPKNIGEVQIGIYGACYKISIILTMFTQTFRYAAEPFFFTHSKEKNAKDLYANVMNYFVIICCIIFLGTLVNLSWIQYFIGKDFRSGLFVVPILLLANLCLGVFFNLSIWYKLTHKTHYGAYLTLFGASITLFINFMWIPQYGYVASAWATLICYASMMVASYLIGNKHYPVNYDLKRILGYLGLSVTLYFLSLQVNISSTLLQLLGKNLILVFFVAVVFFIERPNLLRKSTVT